MTAAPPTFERVQILRFLAALAVVLAHAEWIVGGRIAATTGVEAPGLFAWGTSGVDLFFVISGFIIRYMIAARDHGAGAFLRRRLERIVPLYWLCLAGAFAIMVVTGAGGAGQSADAVTATFLRSLGFLAWTGGQGVPTLSVGWTLEYEMLFYALAALCLVATRRPALLLLAALTVMVATGRLIGVAKGDLVLLFLSNPMLVEFMFGILIANVLLGDRPWISAVLVAVALAFVPLGVMGQRVWIAGLGGALLVAAAVWLDRRGPAARWTRPFVALGDSSYAIYLTHLGVLPVLGVLLARIVPGIPIAVATLIAACVSVAAGYLTYRLVERPILRLLRGKRDIPAPAERPVEAEAPAT